MLSRHQEMFTEGKCRMEAFDVVVEDGVADVFLKRSEEGNPVDWHFVSELRDLACDLSERPDVRCILFRADGRYFSIGANLKAKEELNRQDLPSQLKRSLATLNTAVTRLARGDAPVVVSVHALATGGVLSLIGMADFVLAGTSATFYPAFARIGYSADAGTSFFVPRRVGTRKALEFFMLNQMWDAELALANGLISRVVSDESLLQESRALARQLAAGPTKAYGEIRRLLLSTDQSLEGQMDLEIQAISRCARTEDCWNAIKAVSAKQAPQYQGR
jgi:2-(1,2-epoxy-1,2-dihydrophenyl)acetyl-CoA isomerase